MEMVLDPKLLNWLKPYQSIIDVVNETRTVFEKLTDHRVFYGTPNLLEKLLTDGYEISGPPYWALKKWKIEHQEKFSLNLSTSTERYNQFKVYFIEREWVIFLLNKKQLQEVSDIKHPNLSAIVKEICRL